MGRRYQRIMWPTLKLYKRRTTSWEEYAKILVARLADFVYRLVRRALNAITRMLEDPAKALRRQLDPDRTWFGRDPFGYSGLAWHRWCIAKELAGQHANPEIPPTSTDLKSPVLWLAQAHAMSEAAAAVFAREPRWEHMPTQIRGICDSQYCATGLMLVGYSLEICLKAMLIVKHGVEAYSEREREFKHHRLDELASLMPNLSEKDLAVLRLLTLYLKWAGRYPDPGSGRESDAEKIFELSERFQVAAKDLFELANRVMKHVATLPELGHAD